MKSRHQERKNGLSEPDPLPRKRKRSLEDSVDRKSSSTIEVPGRNKKQSLPCRHLTSTRNPSLRNIKGKNTNKKRTREARGNTKPIQNGSGTDPRQSQKSKNLRSQNKNPYILEKKKSRHPRNQKKVRLSRPYWQ
jgi:hypothetical protein